MIFYGLKTCDSCRKAQKQLRENGIAFHAVDVRADGVSKEKLRTWIDKLGWQVLLNTRSTTWRGLEPEDKTDLDGKKALELLASYSTLIKRPVIESGDQIYVGWKDAQAALIPQ